MFLLKNYKGKILFNLLPLFVLITLSLSYFAYQQESQSYSGAACGYSSNNTNFFRPCANTNQCIQETCIGATPESITTTPGSCQFTGYKLTPSDPQYATWLDYNAGHPTMPIGYYCACVGEHYRNGRCEPYLGENIDTAPMDCTDGTCPEGVSPSGRFAGTSFCGDRIIPVTCNTNTPPSTTFDGCCPTAEAFAAADPDCCPPPNSNSSSCGNGTVDAGETCDYSTTKPSGFNASGQDLPNGISCRLTSVNGACTYCGDGIVQATAGEQCDTAQTTSSCASGFSCNEGCQCKPSSTPPTNSNEPDTPITNSDTPNSQNDNNTPSAATATPSDRLQGSGGCSLNLR